MFREDKVCFYPQTVQNDLTKWPETVQIHDFAKGVSKFIRCRVMWAISSHRLLNSPGSLRFFSSPKILENMLYDEHVKRSVQFCDATSSVSLGTALLDHSFQQQNPFSDGWGEIICQSCTELDQYPISTLQSHTQSSHHFAWPMIISSQSYVSSAVWVLSNITTSALPAETLVVVPQCCEWCLCNLQASITSCKELF